MKAFATLLCTMVALASAAAVNYDSSFMSEDAIAKREAAAALGFDPADPLSKRRDQDFDIVTEDLGDGSSKIDIVANGISGGYLILGTDGEVHGYDGNGQEFDLDTVLAARDDLGIEKRQLGLIRVLARLAPLIKRFGSRVISWIKCVGAWSQLLDCSSKLVNCAQYGHPPWECAAGISCIGKAAKNCR